MVMSLKTNIPIAIVRKMVSNITSQHLEPINKMVLLRGKIDA